MTTLQTNPPRAPRSWARLNGPAPVVLRFLGLAGLGGIAVSALAAGPLLAGPGAMAATLGLYLASALLAAWGLMRGYPHATLGLANVTTLLRLVLTASLAAPVLIGGTPGWAVFALATLALSLDGVDGWLARRQRLTSRFGALFDMEVDAALGLILALNAWAAGSVGPAVLILGLPRYLFLLAGRALPWMQADLPDRMSRKAVCVAQITALISLQLPLLPDMWASVILFVAAVALVWSFARDILWLWRARS